MHLKELNQLDKTFRNQDWVNEYIKVQIEQLFNKDIFYIELPIFLTPKIIDKAIRQLGWHTIKMGDKHNNVVREEYEKENEYITLFIDGWDGLYEIRKGKNIAFMKYQINQTEVEN